MMISNEIFNHCMGKQEIRETLTEIAAIFYAIWLDRNNLIYKKHSHGPRKNLQTAKAIII